MPEQQQEQWPPNLLKEYTNSLIDALQGEMDRRIETVLRELQTNRNRVDITFAATERLIDEKVKRIDDSVSHQKEYLSTLARERNEALVLVAANIDIRLNLLEQELDRRVTSVITQLGAAQDAQKEAVIKAEVSTEKRLEGLNEFRATLADQAKDLMPREVADTQFKELRLQIQSITDRFNTGEGHKQGGVDYRVALMGVIVILISIAAIISPHVK